MTIVVTQSIVDRIVAIETANLVSRLGPYRKRPGNPAGVHIERFGEAVAFVSAVPVRFFNSVLGVTERTVDDLDAIEAFYAEHDKTPSFEIVPGRMPESFALELHRRGYAMVEFHCGTVREPKVFDDRDIAIETIDRNDPAALDRFLDVSLEGWAGPGDHEDAKQNMRHWAENDAWTFYVATLDGADAGSAILDVRDKTALVSSASTAAAFRGRGVQRALLERRVSDAARAGCDLVVGGAYWGTSSVRNQQRAGFSTAFTRSIWIHAA